MEYIVYIIRPFTVFLPQMMCVLHTVLPAQTIMTGDKRAILSSLHMINIDSAFYHVHELNGTKELFQLDIEEKVNIYLILHLKEFIMTDQPMKCNYNMVWQME